MDGEALVLLVHVREGDAVAVQGPELIIGRRSGCGLVISGPEVSREHARLVETEEGYVLEDLASSNGTFLNGRRIERARVEPGDEIRIGRAVLTVHRFSDGHLGPGPAEEAFAEGDRLREEGLLAEAAAAYERGLTARPGAHDRLLVLGGLMEALGRWQKAEEAYRAVPVSSAAHDEAARALRRIEEKWRIYGKVKTLLVEDGPATEALLGLGEAVVVEGPGWTIRYPLGADTALLKTMAKTLAVARSRLVETVGEVPETLPIEVYLSAEELHRASPAHTEDFATWMAGVYDGVVRVAIGEETLPEPPFLVLLLAHEVAHVAVEAASGGRCPAWLDEGIAQCVAQNLTRRAERSLVEAAWREALIPLMVLEAPLHLLEKKPLVDLAYAQAQSVVAFLEEAEGWKGIRALLAGLAEGLSVDEALEALGWPYPRLEAGWHASLMGQGG
jgi:tetratricopeptide (TPR) repeat protein